jgi:hypothetical protein
VLLSESGDEYREVEKRFAEYGEGIQRGGGRVVKGLEVAKIAGQAAARRLGVGSVYNVVQGAAETASKDAYGLPVDPMERINLFQGAAQAGAELGQGKGPAPEGGAEPPEPAAPSAAGEELEAGTVVTPPVEDAPAPSSLSSSTEELSGSGPVSAAPIEETAGSPGLSVLQGGGEGDSIPAGKLSSVAEDNSLGPVYKQPPESATSPGAIAANENSPATIAANDNDVPGQIRAVAGDRPPSGSRIDVRPPSTIKAGGGTSRRGGGPAPTVGGESDAPGTTTPSRPKRWVVSVGPDGKPVMTPAGPRNKVPDFVPDPDHVPDSEPGQEGGPGARDIEDLNGSSKLQTSPSNEASRAAAAETGIPELIHGDGTVLTRADFPDVVPDQAPGIGRPARNALPLGRPVGGSDVQNAEVQQDIEILSDAGATDFRVNQRQTIGPQQAGTNRPDLSCLLNGRRVHIEYDRFPMSRAIDHAQRILTNDPDAIVILKGVDYDPVR